MTVAIYGAASRLQADSHALVTVFARRSACIDLAVPRRPPASYSVIKVNMISVYGGRDANLRGALATGIQDAVRYALVAEPGVDGTAVAALLAKRERPGQSITQLAASLLSPTHSGAVWWVNRQLGCSWL